MDIWKNSSRAKKGAVIVGIVVIGFLICKWLGWL
jgi:mannose/fructose/N-acetylgalactosamine-specific phosphotransferase system component IID